MCDADGAEPTVCRSALAVPGSDRHMMEKAMGVGADEVFFDLEDAVAPSRKDDARSLVSQALEDLAPFSHVQAVRINEVGSGMAWRDVVSIVEAAGDTLDRIIIPKVRSAADVTYIDHLLTELEGSSGGGESQIGLEVLVETAAGAAHLGEILRASDRVTAVILGLGDYTAELGVARPLTFGIDSGVTSWAASQVVNYAVAAGMAPVDGPFPALRDEAGYRDACARAKGFGFVGKWCVHPAQVQWCNEAFAPGGEEVREARRVLDAYEDGMNRGRGAVSLDGRLVDEATRKSAARVVALAERLSVERR